MPELAHSSSLRLVLLGFSWSSLKRCGTTWTSALRLRSSQLVDLEACCFLLTVVNLTASTVEGISSCKTRSPFPGSSLERTPLSEALRSGHSNSHTETEFKVH